MNHEKSKGRQAVECVLRTATREAPLTVAQVAERSGVNISDTQLYIAKCVHAQMIVNVGARRRSAYVWASQGAEAEMECRIPTEPYTAPRWLIRDGGEDHKGYGSRRGDTVAPWEPPLLICPVSVEVVGVYRGRS